MATTGKEEDEGTKSLARTLKHLPDVAAEGAAGAAESDCFRVMR